MAVLCVDPAGAVVDVDVDAGAVVAVEVMALAAATPLSAQLFVNHCAICDRSVPLQTPPQLAAGSVFNVVR